MYSAYGKLLPGIMTRNQFRVNTNIQSLNPAVLLSGPSRYNSWQVLVFSGEDFFRYIPRTITSYQEMERKYRPYLNLYFSIPECPGLHKT